MQARTGPGPAARQATRHRAIQVLPLYGVISHRANLFEEASGGTSIQGFSHGLRQALNDDAVESILIDIDSPGGSVNGVEELAREIHAARGSKPIWAVANTLAASAAYWIGSQADEFLVTPSAEIGAIGVVMVHEERSEADAKEGVRHTVISKGSRKSEGTPFEPLSEEARAAIEERAEVFYGMFVGSVARGRGLPEETVRSGFGEGALVPAAESVRLGMADGVATFEETLTRMAQTPPTPRSMAASASATYTHPLSASTETEPATDEPPDPERVARLWDIALTTNRQEEPTHV